MRIGPVMMDIAGTQLTVQECQQLTHPLVGGVILFKRNYQDYSQLCQLVEQIRSLRNPLLIAVDQEGGRVQRFRDGFTSLPPLAHFGQLYEKDAQQALEQARQLAYIMAKEIRAVGIDISLAPVLDVDRGLSSVIGDRSFSQNPAIVIQLACAYITGMREAGMSATGKHFPGHGAVAADSHLCLPEDNRDFEVIFQEDIQTFQQLKDQLWGIMPAHIRYTQVDNLPAGFSSFWLQTILREKIDFQGVIISDDLSMSGAEGQGGYLNRAQKALAVGCDMIIVCNHAPGLAEILAGLSYSLSDESQARILKGLGKTDLKCMLQERA